MLYILSQPHQIDTTFLDLLKLKLRDCLDGSEQIKKAYATRTVCSNHV
jgi:hypothetical protein